MAKKMCPLLMMKHDEAFKCNCQKESCVWWSKSTEDCAILMIGNYIVTGWALLYDFLGKDKKEVK